jgi:hypothetical protein
MGLLRGLVRRPVVTGSATALSLRVQRRLRADRRERGAVGNQERVPESGSGAVPTPQEAPGHGGGLLA